MVNENLIPKTEEVREIKNEIPTYEEFMKTYQSDDLVNASYWAENEAQIKGYGPCRSCLWNAQQIPFKLKIVLKNFLGSEKSKTVYNVGIAYEEIREIKAGSGFWKDFGFFDCFSDDSREKLARRIESKIDWHVENRYSVDTTVCNKDDNSSESDSSLERAGYWADKNSREGWGETNEYRGR